MIPVQPQPEPDSFDRDVRRKGQRWIRRKKLDPKQPPPRRWKLPPYWQACLTDLHHAYGGICAYLCIYIERPVGGTAVEHFVAKSVAALELAYEWSNYRLACDAVNCFKGVFADVLDPFELRPGMFQLELITGVVFPDPDLDPVEQRWVNGTIDRLRLDSPECREMRARHYRHFLHGDWSPQVLHDYSPFVWTEARRQGLLNLITLGDSIGMIAPQALAMTCPARDTLGEVEEMVG